jgi:hypothetical protein
VDKAMGRFGNSEKLGNLSLEGVARELVKAQQSDKA